MKKKETAAMRQIRLANMVKRTERPTMPRPVVFKDKTKYNRQRDKLALKKEGY